MKNIMKQLSLVALLITSVNAQQIEAELEIDNARLLAGTVFLFNDATGELATLDLTPSAPLEIITNNAFPDGIIRSFGADDLTPTTHVLTLTSTSVTNFAGTFLIGGVQIAREFFILDVSLATFTNLGTTSDFDPITGRVDNSDSANSLDTFTFTGSTGSISITTDGAGNGLSQFISNFTIDLPGFRVIPEPSSALLLGLSGLALLARRKR